MPMAPARHRPTMDSHEETKETEMYSYPELTLLVATEYQRALIADAEQHRLLSQVRRSRRARRASRRAAAVSAPAGNLAPCVPAAV
jgi:hypothetical protein